MMLRESKNQTVTFMCEVTALTYNRRPGLREPQDCVAYATCFLAVTSGNLYVIRAILITQ
jgi:hypothetical protein